MQQATASGLLGHVIALNAWRLVMEVRMYAVNIPVMEKLNLGNTITRVSSTPRHPHAGNGTIATT